MKKAQALQVMCALFEEETMGADGENPISKTMNQSFIRACLVACPDLPAAYQFAPWLKHTPTEGTPLDQARRAWARFLRDLADGIEGMEEPKA